MVGMTDSNGYLKISLGSGGVISGDQTFTGNVTIDGDLILGNTGADSLSMVGPIDWTAGVAVTAGAYEIVRDADATNQLHFNVPTGAGFEISENDVAKITMTTGGLWNHTIASIVGGQTGFTGTYTTSGAGGSNIVGHIITLAAGYTGNGITNAMAFDNVVAGVGTGYVTDATYGSRPHGNRGMGGYTRATTTGVNTGLLGIARGGVQNWGAWMSSTEAEANKSNIGAIGVGLNDAAGGEGIGVYALYDNPSAVPTIPADAKTALFVNNSSNAADIALFTDNGTEVFAIGDYGYIQHTPTGNTSGTGNYSIFTSPTDTNLTLSTEVIGHSWSGAVKQWATGALMLQREFAIGQPTYSFVGASTMTLGATFAITAGPTEGTNATIASSTALMVGGSDSVKVTSGNYSNIFVVPNPLATGVTNINAWYGYNYASGLSISLGDTGGMDELAAFKNSGLTFTGTGTGGNRTVTVAAGAIFNAPVAGANMTFSNVYGLFVDSGVSRFDGGIFLNNSSATGIGTDITGTMSTALTISVPDTTAGAGVDISIIASAAGGAGPSAGGSIILEPGASAGAAAPGRIIFNDTSSVSRLTWSAQGASDHLFGSTAANITYFGVYGATQTFDFAVLRTDSSANYVQAAGGTTGVAATLTATGEANAALTLATSGTGIITLNDATAINSDATAGGVSTLTVTPGAHTAVTAQIIDFSVAAHTMTITGGYTAQNFSRFAQPTVSAASSLTLTNAATVDIIAPTVAASAKITNTVGLNIGSVATGVSLANIASSTYSHLKLNTTTLTLTATTQITSADAVSALRAGIITINQSGGAVTVDNAATVYIEGAVAAGASVTLTNPYSLFVDAGLARLDGGVIFGTTSQSTLANYEENTFAPTVTLVGGAGNTTPVYSTNTGRYTRVGNRVLVDVYLTGDGGAEGAGTGVINIALPLTAGASNPTGFFPAGYAANNVSDMHLAGQIAGGATTIQLYYWSAVTTVSYLTGDQQNNATRTIRLKFSYEV